MMRHFPYLKQLCICTIALLMAGMVQAAPVDRETATQAARSFWQHTLRLEQPERLTIVEAGEALNGMYLLCHPTGGYVLMSAQSSTHPVLAYSATGRMEAFPTAPQQLYLLEVFGQEIAAAAEIPDLPEDPDWHTLLSGKALKDKSKSKSGEYVEPLCQTQWGQMSPYNTLCPSGCPSGCVSTSTTQVMKFWNYPPFGQGSHMYTSDEYGPQQADFAHTRYRWEHMPNVLDATASDSAKIAVATLTYHVGVSVNMNYNSLQSGAVAGASDSESTCAMNSLWRYFHYNKASLTYQTKGETDNDTWADLLMEELRLHRPIIYGGSSVQGGHSFICDGFDSLRMLHFNIGQNGVGDGYYAIGAIDAAGVSFNQMNDAIMGIYPEYGLYLSDTSLHCNREGDTLQVWLAACDTTGLPWTVSCDADWLQLRDTAFAQVGSIGIVVAANGTGNVRSTVLTFRQGRFTATLQVSQTAYNESDFCPLTVVMENTHNMGWANDAHLSFESLEGLIYATATHSVSERTSTTQVRVAPHDVVVRWNHGGVFDRYCNYYILNSYGDTLVSVRNAYYNGKDFLISWPCAPADIAEASALETVRLYPNPATDATEIACEGLQILRVELMDVTGRLVRSLPACHTLPLQGVAAGLYMVRIVTPEGVATRRLSVTQ